MTVLLGRAAAWVPTTWAARRTFLENPMRTTAAPPSIPAASTQALPNFTFTKLTPEKVALLMREATNGMKALFPNATDVRVSPKFGNIYGQPITTVTARVEGRELKVHFRAMGLEGHGMRLQVDTPRAGDPSAYRQKDGSWKVLTRVATPEQQKAELERLKNGATMGIGAPTNFIDGREMHALVEAARGTDGALTETGRAFLKAFQASSKGSYLSDTYFADDFHATGRTAKDWAKPTLSMPAWLELRAALAGS